MVTKQCSNCKWYETYVGACSNGLNKYIGDFTNKDMQDCGVWESNEYE